MNTQTNFNPSYIDSIGPSVNLLDKQLNMFGHHNLQQQERANLLNRVDDKFVIKRKDLMFILGSLQDEYTILREAGQQCFKYETVYFDTPDYELFHMHHSGKKNRFKVRTRKYLNTHQIYHELKIKNNKGLTQKIRKEGNFVNPANKFDPLLIHNITGRDANEFTPTLNVFYDRLTFMHKVHEQRLTIDLNIRFNSIHSHHSKSLIDTVIIEIKRSRDNNALKHSPPHAILKQLGYRPTQFSKYCMGCLLTLTPNIKHNLFKLNLLALPEANIHSYMEI